MGLFSYLDPAEWFLSTDPRDEGYVAGHNGKFQDDNPYTSGSKKEEWDRGWQEGHRVYLERMDSRRGVDINDIGLQLSAMLQQGKRLTPDVAKMLHRHLGQKNFQIQETGDGGIAVTLDGQIVAGPFHSADEVRAAIQELQSGMQRGYNPAVKGWLNWTLLTGGLASGDPIMTGLGLGGVLSEALASAIQWFTGSRRDEDED